MLQQKRSTAREALAGFFPGRPLASASRRAGAEESHGPLNMNTIVIRERTLLIIGDVRLIVEPPLEHVNPDSLLAHQLAERELVDQIAVAPSETRAPFGSRTAMRILGGSVGSPDDPEPAAGVEFRRLNGATARVERILGREGPVWFVMCGPLLPAVVFFSGQWMERAAEPGAPRSGDAVIGQAPFTIKSVKGEAEGGGWVVADAADKDYLVMHAGGSRWMGCDPVSLG